MTTAMSDQGKHLNVSRGCDKMISNKVGVFRIILLIGICCIMYYFGIELQKTQEKSEQGSEAQSQKFKPARASMLYQAQEALPSVKAEVQPEVPKKKHKKVPLQVKGSMPKTPGGSNNQLSGLGDICDADDMQKQTRFDPTGVSRLFAVDATHPVFYCPIQKVGSSFWLRTLTVMGSQNKYATPYEITLAQKNLQYFSALRKDMTNQQIKTFLHDAFSFIFVRDPYSRLFSGYIDKVYYPNVVYWPSFTTEIVKAVRKNPSADSLKFGHDVTFPEFIEYILKLYESKKDMDIHFAPMHELCNPCKVKYSFVGRFENFQEDADNILEYFRSRFPDFTLRFDDFAEESIYDETIRHVRMLFAAIDTNRATLKYPIYKFLQRGWSNAQLRGHLSKTEKMPFVSKNASSTTVEQFMDAVEHAMAVPSNKTLIKNQRQEALIEAYRALTPNLLERLRRFVEKDCKWFGYADKPKSLYDRKNTILSAHHYLEGL